MALQQTRQRLTPPFQHVPSPLDTLHVQAQLARKPWFTSREAMIFTDRPTLAAWYNWRDRHGIVTDNAGRVLRRDVQRALDTPRKKRVVHPNSLRALRASRPQVGR